MNKDEANRKLAEWLGVPCWHEWEWVKPNEDYDGGWWCPPCDQVIAWNSDTPDNWSPTNPDYYTPEGFFALLDGLATKQFNINVEFYGDTSYYIKLAQTDEWTAFGQNADLPTALVEAALQAMENENG